MSITASCMVRWIRGHLRGAPRRRVRLAWAVIGRTGLLIRAVPWPVHAWHTLIAMLS